LHSKNHKHIIPVNSFTINYPEIRPAIITECGISLPFDPQKGGKHPPILKYNALWDTGATGTVITQKVVDELGLKPTGRTKVRGVNTEKETFKYLVNVLLPNNVGLIGITVLVGELFEFDVLIGMDIISRGDFSISNFNNQTTFSFRLPSIKPTDFVKEDIKLVGILLAHAEAAKNIKNVAGNLLESFLLFYNYFRPHRTPAINILARNARKSRPLCSRSGGENKFIFSVNQFCSFAVHFNV